jgi:tetratricopeptide (TPR) repeat protein
MYITNPLFWRVARKKDYEEGILTAEALLRAFSRPDGTFLFPADVTLNLHAFLANTYRRAKKYNEAILYANKLISLSPYNANNYYILGLIYDNLQKPKETLAAWRRATELDKYDVSFFYHYHLALAKYKSIDEAAEYLGALAKSFEGERMPNLSKLALKFRDCLLLPPEEIGEPPTLGAPE